MTLDELIAAATEMKKYYGGDILVGCWPYDGQLLRSCYTEHVSLEAYEDVQVVPEGHSDYAGARRTLLMLEHV